jgi:NRAMP (natural resistance-associated macrophage protein)-like metal ion transporter
MQVIGSAIALLLLSRGAVPLWAGVLLSVSISFVMLLVERWGVTKLEALFGMLISVMVCSFAVSGANSVWCLRLNCNCGAAECSFGSSA